MQWVPFGGSILGLMDHVRTFASVFPEVVTVKGAGGYGFYMLGSSEPIAFSDADVREVLARPGVLEDISSAYDSPASTVDGWIDVIARQIWLTGDAVRAQAGARPADHGRSAAARVFPAPPRAGVGAGMSHPSYLTSAGCGAR